MEANRIKKGQYVVYGTNGVCHVDDVCEMAFPAGQEKKPYLLLRPLSDSASVIYLPSENQALIEKLRPTLTRRESEVLLASASERQMEWIEDRKLRTFTFRNMIQQSHPDLLLSLIRCVCVHRDELAAQNKKLASADREAMEAAFKAICEELVFSLERPREEIIEQIEKALAVQL